MLAHGVFLNADFFPFHSWSDFPLFLEIAAVQIQEDHTVPRGEAGSQF